MTTGKRRSRRPAGRQARKAKAPQQTPPPAPKEPELIDSKRKSDLHNIIDRLIDNNGKAFYSLISSEMKQKYSDFIPKNFGCNSFKKLMEKLLPCLKRYTAGTEADGTSWYLVRSPKR